jgi:hypothetical protein
MTPQLCCEIPTAFLDVWITTLPYDKATIPMCCDGNMAHRTINEHPYRCLTEKEAQHIPHILSTTYHEWVMSETLDHPSNTFGDEIKYHMR